MTPRIKIGLIAGTIGLLLNICVAAALGICGPVVAFLAGLGAGYFSSQRENVSVKNDGARVGAISGGIAGAMVLVGQMIGGVAVLALTQASGIETIFGSVPSTSASGPEQMLYYVGGLGVGLCFGIVGVVVAVLGGAGGGYLGAKPFPEVPFE